MALMPSETGGGNGSGVRDLDLECCAVVKAVKPGSAAQRQGLSAGMLLMHIGELHVGKGSKISAAQAILLAKTPERPLKLRFSAPVAAEEDEGERVGGVAIGSAVPGSPARLKLKVAGDKVNLEQATVERDLLRKRVVDLQVRIADVKAAQHGGPLSFESDAESASGTPPPRAGGAERPDAATAAPATLAPGALQKLKDIAKRRSPKDRGAAVDLSLSPTAADATRV